MGEELLSAPRIELLERDHSMEIDSEDEDIPIAVLLARTSRPRGFAANEISAEEELDLFAFPSDAEMLELLDTVESQVQDK
jgi:hypothetical protein